jgi:hypothetical protein
VAKDCRVCTIAFGVSPRLADGAFGVKNAHEHTRKEEHRSQASQKRGME